MKANQCHHCGIFCKYEEMDSYTPYGCANPASPEPYDPTDICKKCSAELKLKYLDQFRRGVYNYGDWMKSNAEREAAEECGLVWIGNDSGLIWNGRKLYNEYIPKAVYENLME